MRLDAINSHKSPTLQSPAEKSFLLNTDLSLMHINLLFQIGWLNISSREEGLEFFKRDQAIKHSL